VSISWIRSPRTPLYCFWDNQNCWYSILQITLESTLVHHVDVRHNRIEANDLSAPLPVRPNRTIFQHGELRIAICESAYPNMLKSSKYTLLWSQSPRRIISVWQGVCTFTSCLLPQLLILPVARLQIGKGLMRLVRTLRQDLLFFKKGNKQKYRN
jgi:hypothetical protein